MTVHKLLCSGFLIFVLNKGNLRVRSFAPPTNIKVPLLKFFAFALANTNYRVSTKVERKKYIYAIELSSYVSFLRFSVVCIYIQFNRRNSTVVVCCAVSCTSGANINQVINMETLASIVQTYYCPNIKNGPLFQLVVQYTFGEPNLNAIQNSWFEKGVPLPLLSPPFLGH